jgi:hypothetical protein
MGEGVSEPSSDEEADPCANKSDGNAIHSHAASHRAG